MAIPKEIDEKLFTLKDALTNCFGSYETHENGRITVSCCGRIRYYSGLIGGDMVECESCKKMVFNVLSPHVSPFLIGDGVTHMINEEFVKAIGNRCWMVRK